jgi:Fic family protein
MKTKDKIDLLLKKYNKVTLSNNIKVSRPTLDRYLEGSEPDSRDVKLKIDFLYYKEYGLKDPSDAEMAIIEEQLLENQYLIDPKEEFVFKDYIKKIAFGSYEIEAEGEISEDRFRAIADGGEIERDISRKNFLEMANLYSLTLKIIKDASVGREIEITDETLRQWHYSLMQGIRSDAGEYSSKIRVIENSSVETAHPSEIPSAVIKWAEKSKGIKTLRDIAQSHALLEKIHPFGDGNGRIGRLVVAVQCISAGFVPPLINRENSAVYYAALEATQIGGKTNALTSFFAEAIRSTTAQLPLLPKGVEAAKQVSTGSFLKYGYNHSFMNMAVCKNQNLIEALHDQTTILKLDAVKANQAAINELTLEFAYGSSKMEGSTFSKLDTKKFLEFGVFPDYKYDDEDDEQKEIDKLMALNNNHIIETLLLSTPTLSLDAIIDAHDIIISGIKGQGVVGITNESRMVFTKNGQYLPVVGKNKLEGLLREVVTKANQIEDPFVKSFFLHLNIAHIQPFDDGNKRTARAVANIPLIEAGIVPFSYDEMSRDRYIEVLGQFYEYGDSADRLGGILLKSYEKEIELVKKSIEDNSDTSIDTYNQE